MRIYWYKGKKNIVGGRVRQLRGHCGLTQQQLAQRLQLLGYDFDRLTVLRIEAGTRFVADYEVGALAAALEVPADTLLADMDHPGKGE